MSNDNIHSFSSTPHGDLKPV